ncbi:hypothetical protein Tco_0523290 [Tanacetum coccineum]
MIVMMMKTMMMMKALQLDQTRVSHQKGEDTIQVLLVQLNLLQKMMSKVRRNHGSLMHLLPNNPALTSTGWQITDTRDVVVDSSMPRSDTESEHSEQSSDDIPMQDEGHVSDLEDTDNAHIPKVSTTTWNGRSSAKADLEGQAINLVKDLFIRPTSFLHICFVDECHKLLTNKVDLDNSEGHQILAKYLFLLNIQEKLNHLPKTDKTSLHMAVNMWIRNLAVLLLHNKITMSLSKKPLSTETGNDQRSGCG